MNQLAALRSPDAIELPTGTRLLHGLYRIVNQLQQGGFGITYIAVDSLDREVVIKECFPSRICERVEHKVHAAEAKYEPLFLAFKTQFVREAKRLATLKHPNIVAVHQVFEENDSVYMAQDLIDGVDLFTMLERAPDRLTPDFLESALRQVLTAVSYVHGHGLLHRDIAPDNICVDSEDQVLLIDFGAACDYTFGAARTDAALPAVKDGYSPPEFYDPDGEHDCRSDIYSLGATFYHLITGEIPLAADLREEALMAGAVDPYEPLTAGKWGYHRGLLATIDRSLSLDVRRRPQSADEWLNMLDTAMSAEAVQQAEAAPAPETVQVAARTPVRPGARVATYDAPVPHPVERPARAPVADSDLDAKLSALVNETNRNLDGSPAAANDAANDRAARATPDAPADVARPAARSAEPPPLHGVTGHSPRRQWVDIYGAPIDDMVVWQTEQDREAKRRKREQRENERMAAEAAAEAAALAREGRAAAERKSLLGGLLARFTSPPDNCPA